ncbi:hypothetical protein A2U01_0078458, partial [Trifolium medium]|nr:hypothetical protein [Trifolium medium]
CNVMDG